jgi:preprotein translocase subunit SecD
MRYLFYTFLGIFTALILWINLSKPIPINFTIFGNTVKTEIPLLAINFQMGERVVRRDFQTQLGLDLKGGSHLVFEADSSSVAQADLQDALQASRDIIERRVNLFGVSEPVVRVVQSGGNYRINVDLPGITDTMEASRLIGQTAKLNFREKSSDVQDSSASAQFTFLALTKETGLSGKDVKKASVVFDPSDGQPQVQLNFTPEGAKKFTEITKRNIGKEVGIFLDDMIISAPVVQQEIRDSSAVISGSFTVEAAKQLATAINSGALPLSIRLVEQRSIGPSLGALEVQKSLFAGVLGLVMVMIFMIIYYGRLGVIAGIGLMIYGVLTFTIFKIIPIVLTLPGIAGFILSIGMAVDANILIFERIKEELRNGKPFSQALKVGFGRAIDAIKDANITTLLVAFILFNPLNWEFLPQFGLVRGFALTLAIGVLTSLFTGVFITKRLINFFATEEVKKI